MPTELNLSQERLLKIFREIEFHRDYVIPKEPFVEYEPSDLPWMVYFGIAKKKTKFNYPFGFVEFEPDPMIFKDYETFRDDKLKFIAHPSYGVMLNAPKAMFVSNVTA